ncbi:UDP-glucose dehydrogenase family protein [Candidatus Latescibacterota bacterium]
MKITILGTGYVGLVTGACFAEMGNSVTCIDTDEKKVDMLNKSGIPIYEPGLERLIEDNVKEKRLSFALTPEETISRADVVFICVGTPPGKDGSADLSHVFSSAETIGRLVEGYTVVVTKSTVPVGTTAKVKAIVKEEISSRGSDTEVDFVNNPEFLKEGTAVQDFMGPDRVVVGTDSERAANVMRRLYSPFFRTDNRTIFMSIESSELTKYASNTMLATRISFMNEMALLAEKVGASIEDVRQGMAHDRRIGKYFLYAGAGYGGSCFPKDISALVHLGNSVGSEMRIVRAVDEANRKQKSVIADKVLRFFNHKVKGLKIAVWGLAFKPETDDIREAPAIEVIELLRSEGALLAVTDPEAIENAKKMLGADSIKYHKNLYNTIEGADALIVMTEWKEYRTPDWTNIHRLMANPAVFDGRNLYNPQDMKEFGFRYFGVGHGERI